jgi:MEDS: MEthanogen/methylotroph, DcmR Sensory domain
VQFYQTDGHLLDLLTRFIGTALVTGEVAVVVATKVHRDGLAKRFKARGLDVGVSRKEGRFVSLDAAATLSRITIGGRPDAGRFHDVVGALMQKVAPLGERRRVAAFGEMVALLWAEGRVEAALELEEMWNELAKEHAFCLCCAYPMSGFGNRHAASFMKICAQHSHVFTAAPPPSRADALLRPRS